MANASGYDSGEVEDGFFREQDVVIGTASLPASTPQKRCHMGTSSESEAETLKYLVE